MVIEIWIKESDIETLKSLMSRQWFSDAEEYKSIRYRTDSYKEYICVHIGINEYTRLIDNKLLHH